MTQALLPELQTPVPGPRTREFSAGLSAFESRNVTFMSERFPVFWESAAGANIWDADGNRYIDLTAAFGVANTGHGNPRVAAAIADQAGRLMHAMGDVHPTHVKVRLLETLAAITPGDLRKTFLASTGAEAVEAALKTAMIATGKPAFAAYRNAYHGLSLGTLEICGIERFRAPFLGVLPQRTSFLPYPDAGAPDAHDRADAALQEARTALCRRDDIAALIVEPIQGRAGCIVPPQGFLTGLRRLCTELGVLLVFDEIYTGFGRTGTLFACEHEGVTPDILCIGKAMANGFPISATIARAGIMDAWPRSSGEALHTSTHLGNPMGCAAALANIAEIERGGLPARAAEMGALLEKHLRALCAQGKAIAVRGRGLMWGLELHSARDASTAVMRALERGVLLLQAGPDGNVLSITPPLTIAQIQLECAIAVLQECVA